MPTTPAARYPYTRSAMKASTNGYPVPGSPSVTSRMAVPAPMAMRPNIARTRWRQTFESQGRWCYANADADDNMCIRGGQANEACGNQAQDQGVLPDRTFHKGGSPMQAEGGITGVS